MKKYFYVYYSYEEYGRGYIGKRECKCLPKEDTRYFGSFNDKTFKPTQKIILETFDSVEEALEAECALHDFYQVDKNPHFANRAKQTSRKFYYIAPRENMLGENNPAKRPEVREKISAAAKNRKASEETKRKMSEMRKGKPSPKGMLGKKLTEDQRQKIREKKVERDNKIWIIKDPEGKLHTTNNLKYFCELNNLTDSAIHHVISGKRNHHKGWTRA
ncbi:HNH endonuclease [Synechococcus phage S-SRM01]|uniref:Nuclease associated modular domain 3 protein n=1 Tax=Synechococcus phage S-SRM01 TaxID=2781608 RepID=A0A879R3W4_9CAUD|nr:HNH endonuclease [Synechococcus phage S-SRM01]QPX47995.1 nuclease associated modular domain 3 protein [Synechococcus phage S-SRM01]